MGSESLFDDLRECGEHPLTYGQETHGELHLDTLRELTRLKAWHDVTVTLIAALAIYGEQASLPALVAKAQRLNGEWLVCPRCEGQRFDVGACGLCSNLGWLNADGERLRAETT
jgi:hypothetical protein